MPATGLADTPATVKASALPRELCSLAVHVAKVLLGKQSIGILNFQETTEGAYLITSNKCTHAPYKLLNWRLAVDLKYVG